MENFFNNSTVGLKITYIIALLSVVFYLIIKYREKGYIYSIFNIPTLFLGIFTYFIIGVFQYNNEAWGALNIYSADSFVFYLNKCMYINCIGFIFFIIFTIFKEFKYSNKTKVSRIINLVSKNIASLPTLLINIAVLLVWYIIVLKSIGTMPIFGNRMFASRLGFQTFYNILNGAINIFSIYYSIKFIEEKKISSFIFMLLNVITLFFVGNRNILLFTILNMYIFYLYKNYKSVIKINKNIFQAVLVVLGLGIILDFIRRMNMEFDFSSLFNDVLYGNTFCDVRDGAYVLYGMDNQSLGPLLGKTYIADILGFLPTEIIPYRDVWSYGNFTTKTLFGWQHHPGLRGGWFLTSYINFGYIGVIISAYIFAYLYSALECYFYETFIVERNFNNSASKVIVADIVQKISLGLMITSGISQTYARIGIILIITMITILGRKKIYL